MSGVGVIERVTREFVVEWEAVDDDVRPDVDGEPAGEPAGAIARAVPLRLERADLAPAETSRSVWLPGEPL